MPAKSPAQEKLMQAAAHTKGGYDGVPQAVGKEFVGKDSQSETRDAKLDRLQRQVTQLAEQLLKHEELDRKRYRSS